MSEPEITYNEKPRYSNTDEMLHMARENEAKGIQTSVYNWKFPKVLDAPIPMKDIAPHIEKLRRITQKLNNKHPSWDNDQVRAHIKEKFSEFRDLANRTHPHLFLMITDRNLSEKNFQRIQEMICIRFLHEQSNDTEANTKLISSYFQKEFIPDVKK
jgi:hypothetical protein